MNTGKPPVRHHYVPEFLLKRFCSGKKSQVWVFDKHTRRTFRTHVRNVACETHFNNFELDGVKVSAEPALTELEGKVAPLCKRIIRKGEIGSVDMNDRALLAYYAAVQLVRTRKQRDTILDFHKQLKTWLEERGSDIRDLEGYVEPTDNEIKKEGVMGLKAAKDLSVHILDKAWIMWRAPKSSPFYLSDHPIATQNRVERPFRGNLGLAVEGIEIYFPLSGRYCLSMVCQSYYEKIVGGFRKHVEQAEKLPESLRPPKALAEPIQKLANGFVSGVAVDAAGENVENINSLQVLGSARYVFCENEQFELVESMLDENPDVAFGRKMGTS